MMVHGALAWPMFRANGIATDLFNSPTLCTVPKRN
jgi:hypothetical protein